MRRLQNSQLRTGLALEEGDMLIISKKRSRRMLKGDEFETLIAADSDARGEHE